MLKLEKKYFNEIISHAMADDPDECCGILAGDSGEVTKLFRMTNIEHSPYRYNMDPKELYETYMEIDQNNWDLLAIYHSHTHSPAYPSDTDIRLATWPDSFYILVSLMDHNLPVMRAFKLDDGQVVEIELSVV